MWNCKAGLLRDDFRTRARISQDRVNRFRAALSLFSRYTPSVKLLNWLIVFECSNSALSNTEQNGNRNVVQCTKEACEAFLSRCVPLHRPRRVWCGDAPPRRRSWNLVEGYALGSGFAPVFMGHRPN